MGKENQKAHNELEMELVNQRWRAVPARRRKGWAVVVALLCIVVPSAAYIRQASVAKRESETETVHSKVAASTGSSALVQHRDRVRSDNDTYRIELYLPGVTTQSRDSYKCMAVPVKAKGYVVRYEPKAEMNVRQSQHTPSFYSREARMLLTNSSLTPLPKRALGCTPHAPPWVQEAIQYATFVGLLDGPDLRTRRVVAQVLVWLGAERTAFEYA